MAEELFKEAVENLQKDWRIFQSSVTNELKAIKTGGELSPELREKVERIESSIQKNEKVVDDWQRKALRAEEINKQLEERLDKVQAMFQRPGRGDIQLDRKSFILSNLYRSACRPDEPDREEAFWRTVRNLDVAPEKKALLVSDPATGGWMAPAEQVNEWIKTLQEITPVLELANVRTTQQRSVKWRKKVGQIVASRRGETGTKVEDTHYSVGVVEAMLAELYAYTYVSREDLADVDYNLESDIGADINEAFPAKMGYEFINGTGPKQFEGIAVDSTHQSGALVSGVTSKLGSDSLIEFCDSGIKVQFQNDAIVLCKLATLVKIRQLATSHDYLWVPGFGAMPSTICGRPYRVCEDMPAVGSNTYPLAIGSWKRAYGVILRPSIGVRTMEDTATIKEGTVMIEASMRSGGQILNGDAYRLYKCST